jgi:NAD(P) transhydrogenase subunit alpha
MNPITEQAHRLAERAAELSHQAAALARHIEMLGDTAMPAAAPVAAAAEPIIFLVTIFLLACFVGYYVVWNVTPALHSPLMAVTNGISSVIIVGAMLATGLSHDRLAEVFGFVAVTLASVNIFGGFLVTQRMLSMFKSKK